MKIAILILLATCFAVRIAAQSLADSVAEFSGKQGSNGWYYGYYNLSADRISGYDPTNDFRRFPAYFEGSWNISGSYWTRLNAQYTHPNTDGNNNGKTSQEHWSILRWVSELTGLVRVHGRLAKISTGGDGVIGTVYLNGRKVYEHWISGIDATGIQYSFGLVVHEGDLLDFALSDAGEATSDGSLFTAVVDRADMVLSSGTAIEVAVPTIIAQRYQIHYSTDLDSWNPIGQPFTGTGETNYFLFSIRELGSPGFFKAECLP
jgi:hypothetical protein